METSYKKQTCKQIYENKDLERDQRVEMMKTLSCHKMEFKNFDASLDPFLQADTRLVFSRDTVTFPWHTSSGKLPHRATSLTVRGAAEPLPLKILRLVMPCK